MVRTEYRVLYMNARVQRCMHYAIFVFRLSFSFFEMDICLINEKTQNIYLQSLQKYEYGEKNITSRYGEKLNSYASLPFQPP